MLGSRVIFILMFIFSLLFVVFTDLWMAYVCLFSVVLMFILSLLSITAGKKLVTVEQLLNKNNPLKEEKLELKFIIRNRSFLPIPFLKIKFSDDAVRLGSGEYASVFVTPFFKGELVLDIDCKHIGEYEVSARCVEYNDLLCIFKAVLKINSLNTVFVCPRIYNLNDMPLEYITMLSDAGKSGGLGDDISSVLDIRPYRPGDNCNRIHWKISSKKEELMVRTFQNTMICPTLILFDLYPCFDLSEIDEMIEYTASAAYYLLENMHPLYLCVYQDELEVFQENDIYGFYSIYNMFPRLKFNSAVGINELLEAVVKAYFNVKNIIIVTGNKNERLDFQIRVLREKRYNVNCYTVPEF